MAEPVQSSRKPQELPPETTSNDQEATLPSDQGLKDQIRRNRLTAAAVALGLKPGENFQEGMSARFRYDAPAGSPHSASGGLAICVYEDLNKVKKIHVDFHYQDQPDGMSRTDSWEIDPKSGRVTSTREDKATTKSGIKFDERTGEQVTATDRIRVGTYLEGAAYRPQWYTRRTD